MGAAPGQMAACSDEREKKEWCWRLTAVLQSLLDLPFITAPSSSSSSSSSSTSTSTSSSTQIALQIALSAAAIAEGEEALSRLCELIAEILGRRPQLWESNAVTVLQLLFKCPSSARKLVLDALQMYLGCFPVQQVQKAVHTALQAYIKHGGGGNGELEGKSGGGGGGGHVRAAATLESPNNNAQEGSNKRRRLSNNNNQRHPPLLADSQDQIDFMEIESAVPPGLATVASTLAAVIHSLQLHITSTTQTIEQTDASTKDKSTTTATTTTFAVDALADVVQTLAPMQPLLLAQYTIDTVKKWSGWGSLQFGGRGLTDAQIQSGLKLLSSGLEVALHCGGGDGGGGIGGSLDGIATALMACVRAEGPGAGNALAVAVLGAAVGVADLHLTSPRSLLRDIFEAARGKYAGTQATRAALLPAAATLAATSAAAPPPLSGSSKNKSGTASNHNKQQSLTTTTTTPPSSSNPFKGLLLRMAKSQEPEVVAALVRSVHVVVALADDVPALILNTVYAARAGHFSPLGETPQSVNKRELPLNAFMCDWLRPVLEILCAPDAAATLSSSHSHPELILVVSLFLHNAPLSELEQSKALAEWMMAQIGGADGGVRAAVLRQAPLFASPQLLLTLYHSGTHPSHARERRVAAEKVEQSVILSLKLMFQAAAGDASKAEDLLQLVGHLGLVMKSPTARMLTLAILVLSLEQRDAAVSATAGECLKGKKERNTENPSIHFLIFF